MIRYVLISLLFVSTLNAAEIKQIDNDYANKIVRAIGQIENSTRYPFGVKSVGIKGDTQKEREDYAKKICFNTVKFTYVRWQRAGKTNDFLQFLGNRYCPVKGDATGLNKNWVKNLKSKLNQ